MKKTFLSLALVFALLMSLCVPALAEADTAEITEDDVNAVLDELNGFLNWLYHDGTFKAWYCGHFHMDLRVNDQMFACFEGIYPLGTGPVHGN